MRTRWGLGPVFVCEWLTASRRWQLYALRAGFVGLLFLAVLLVWFNKTDPVGPAGTFDRNAHARAGEALFYGFFGTLLSATLLVAPGVTAGAVCLDKARGTLLHLLVTDLSSAEIVLGKLAARLLPLAGLLLASAPVLSICLWLGGIDPDAMLVAYAVTAGIAVLGSAVAFLFSVWGRKTHEVLLAAYLLEVLLVLAYPIAFMLDSIWKQTWLSDYVAWTNPFRLAFSPYMYRGATDAAELSGFLAFCFGIGGVCSLLAVLTVRSVTVRQAGRTNRRKRRPRRWWRRGPTLDRNPVFWREWRRHRPTPWVRLVWTVYVVCAVAATVAVVWTEAARGTARFGGEFGAFASALQVSVGLLLASVGAVTCLADERVQGSLDVLLASPLTTRAILWGKWRGAFRLVPWLAVLPAINSFASARNGGGLLAAAFMIALVLAYGAGITSMGLACATWIRRFSRAVGAAVVLYAFAAAGWFFLCVVLFNRGTFGRELACGSPFFGPGMLTAAAGHDDRMGETLSAIIVWSVVYLVGAAALYATTLRTFNRCLGRVPERVWRSRGAGLRPRLPKYVPAALAVEVPGDDEQQIR
jgi:ABC-type transport system involved in multi-copper enzyme maturation permease subunit